MILYKLLFIAYYWLIVYSLPLKINSLLLIDTMQTTINGLLFTNWYCTCNLIAYYCVIINWCWINTFKSYQLGFTIMYWILLVFIKLFSFFQKILHCQSEAITIDIIYLDFVHLFDCQKFIQIPFPPKPLHGFFWNYFPWFSLCIHIIKWCQHLYGCLCVF